MQSISEAGSVKEPSNNHFGFCVLVAHECHTIAALLHRKQIDHLNFLTSHLNYARVETEGH